jgi:hypothetical protein
LRVVGTRTPILAAFTDRGAYDITSQAAVKEASRQEHQKPATGKESRPSDRPTITDDLDAGPAIGPALPPPHSEGMIDTNNEILSTETTYATSRAIIRSMTMPPVPNFNIPPSPPGSPPPATTKKLANFLGLKKKGMHFNSKLESSAALRNPGILLKLKDFAGINDYEQYNTPLPDDLAVPIAFPPWAYGDQLNKTQQVMLKKKENEKRTQTRDKIDFVSASSSANAGFRGGKIGNSGHTSSTSRRP